jgi:LysM repeat protein
VEGLPAAEGADEAAGTDGTRQAYVVGSGDTLYSIAARYGTTAALLQRQNGLADELIQPGQTLMVPRAGAGAPSAGGGPKRIEVVIGEQRLYVWEGDALVWSWLASTGIDSHPTRRGS